MKSRPLRPSCRHRPSLPSFRSSNDPLAAPRLRILLVLLHHPLVLARWRSASVITKLHGRESSVGMEKMATTSGQRGRGRERRRQQQSILPGWIDNVRQRQRGEMVKVVKSPSRGRGETPRFFYFFTLAYHLYPCSTHTAFFPPPPTRYWRYPASSFPLASCTKCLGTQYRSESTWVGSAVSPRCKKKTF
jgi:hypothetical protein